jgi:hypothetical protein
MAAVLPIIHKRVDVGRSRVTAKDLIEDEKESTDNSIFGIELELKKRFE